MMQASTLTAAASAVAVLAFSMPASAAVLTAVVNDDAWVQANGPGFNDNRLRVRDDSAPSNIRKTFIEFTLPAAPAGEVIDSATFSVFDQETDSGRNLGEAGARLVQVFGITDESIEAFTESTVTYANAPANVADGSSLDATRSTLLGTFDIGDSQTAGNARSLSSAALVAFLASDTNGIVTFGLVSNDNNGQSTVAFGSKENGTVSGPTLTVTTVVPEPASAGLVLFGAGLIGLRRRR